MTCVTGFSPMPVVFRHVGQLGKLRAGCLPALAGRIANPPGPEGAPASLPHKDTSSEKRVALGLSLPVGSFRIV